MIKIECEESDLSALLDIIQAESEVKGRLAQKAVELEKRIESMSYGQAVPIGCRPEKIEELLEAAKTGADSKITIIKLVRDLTGVQLIVAKDMIERVYGKATQ